MTEDQFNKINKKIFDFSGIIVSTVQKKNLCQLVEKLAASNKIELETYIDNLSYSSSDFSEIINSITVNETYFFREQRVFDVLRKEIFPKFAGKKMNIWSSACSTGEEPISLLAMALSFKIDATVYASDIDENVLNHLKNGIYSNYSFRGDGREYLSLLDPYCGKGDRIYTFNKDFINRIKIFNYNLTQPETMPFYEKMDLIFLRNVFIYFDNPTRKKVTESISSKLNNEGCLFFSLSEIANIDESIVPDTLYKKNVNGVYYFIKGKKPDEEETRRLVLDNGDYLNFIENKRKELRDKTRKAEKKRKAILEEAENQSESADKIDVTEITQKNEGIAIKNLFTNVCEYINANEFTKATDLVKREITEREDFVYKFYMQGYIEYHADNKAEAEKLFASAEMACLEFWPAFFYHGMVLKDVGQELKSQYCLKKCIEILQSKENQEKYNFLLDSFSPAYILSLCNSFIES